MQAILRTPRFCRRCGLAIASLIFAAIPASAAPKIVGIVTDYRPRVKIQGKPAIAVNRNGKFYPVREHEMIYEGDSIVFEPAAGPQAFVKALIDANTEITLNPAHTAPPSQRWPLLQTLLPKLAAAYRWINSASPSESSGPQNAISRGDDDGFAWRAYHIRQG